MEANRASATANATQLPFAPSLSAASFALDKLNNADFQLRSQRKTKSIFIEPKWRLRFGKTE